MAKKKVTKPKKEVSKEADVIGILPVRNAIVYPGTVMPLAIGRERSKKLLDSLDKEDAVLGLLAQVDPETDKPDTDELFSVGTAVSVLKTIKMPQGSVNIIVHGLYRLLVHEFVETEPFIKARVGKLESSARQSNKLKALMVNVKNTAHNVISLSPNVPEEAAVLLENIDDAPSLSDFLAANLNITLEQKQQLLQELNAVKRLEKIQLYLANQLEVLELSQKIQGQVKSSIDKSQREYFLQEQLKAIQAELGVDDMRTAELKKLRERVKKAAMPAEVENEAMRELERLNKMHPSSPEHSIIRTYLDWVCDLPWSHSTRDQLGIRRAQRILNEDHYGLDKIKRRVLEFLAVRKLNPKGKSPILCFVGPPGVGKTSLGKSVARAMGRKFIRISLGGIRDEADIRGHRRTYIGALPGRILQEIRKCGSRNPVFMLDEVDKLGADFRGDPASALLEVLDPEQNDTFTDHYLDQPFDLSDVMFICTANYTEPIPHALEDRMEIIELPGYTENDKLNIAKKYLIPRQLKENGLTASKLKIKDEALSTIIESYTGEAGVRDLERNIASVCRHTAASIAKGTKRKSSIGKSDLAKILGPVKYESEVALRAGMPGVATALAWTPVGGEILFVETARTPGDGDLKLTGQIGDVMKESAEAAFTVVKARASKLKLKKEDFKDYNYHIHVPEGAVPKDGPSAGIAIFASVASLLLNKAVKPEIGMTGEITLRGLVLPIGGLKEKILAAKRAGLKTVIIPSRNRKDMVEVPKEAKAGMKFKFASKAEQVLKAALQEG